MTSGPCGCVDATCVPVLLVCWLGTAVLPLSSLVPPGPPLHPAGWPGSSSPVLSLTPYPPRPTGGPMDCPQAVSPGHNTPISPPPAAWNKSTLPSSSCQGLSLSLSSSSASLPLPLLLCCLLAIRCTACCCPCVCSHCAVEQHGDDKVGGVDMAMGLPCTDLPREACVGRPWDRRDNLIPS